MSKGYWIHAWNTEGPKDERGPCSSLASVAGHVGQLASDYETVVVFRVEDDNQQTIVLRYDVDGFDL